MASMVTPRRGRRSSHLSQRRSATMSMGTPNRASFTAAPEMVIKSSYQCRGLRKWYTNSTRRYAGVWEIARERVLGTACTPNSSHAICLEQFVG